MQQPKKNRVFKIKLAFMLI